MKDWQVKFVPKAASKAERQKEIINFLLTSRGIKQEKEFFSPPHPAKISSQSVGITQTKISRAYQAILSASRKSKRIVIWGDYDADGIIGTSLLWQALWQLGIEAIPFIPDRASGYGVNFTSFKRLYRQYPDIGLLITVDNGIVAHREIEKIAGLGVEVIITDHHAKKKTLPKGKTIIWSDQVCGAAVAWFLAREIVEKKDYALDLVALATVADMMPLLGVNRSLVKFGLRVLEKTDCLGLRALMDQAGIGDQELSVYHLGFLLSPRLNAMGRLYNALDSVRLLCTTNKERAGKLAQKLDLANRERQNLTDQALEKASQIIAQTKQEGEKIIFAHHSSFHHGIIGLVAGKLTERFSRPSIVLSAEDGFYRASCRSIKGFNIIEALNQVGELVEAGGHPLAAGFTVKKKDWPKVKKRLTILASQKITDKMLCPALTIEARVRFSDLDYNFWRKINRFAPFGLGNKEPLFYTPGAIIKSLTRVGRNGDHLKLVLDDSQTKRIEKVSARLEVDQPLLSGIGFGLGQEDLVVGDRVDLAFNLILNRYRGQENLELRLRKIKKSDV